MSVCVGVHGICYLLRSLEVFGCAGCCGLVRDIGGGCLFSLVLSGCGVWVALCFRVLLVAWWVGVLCMFFVSF